MVATLHSAIFAAIAGFLARPCCVIPAALSLAGVGSVGLSNVVVSHRPLFLVSSAASLAVSMWLTFRRSGGAFNRLVAILGSGIVFLVTAGHVGGFDVF